MADMSANAYQRAIEALKAGADDVEDVAALRKELTTSNELIALLKEQVSQRDDMIALQKETIDSLQRAMQCSIDTLKGERR